MGRQRRDMDFLLGERTTEWVGVCGQGTGRSVIISRVPIPAMKIWAKGVYMPQEFAVNNIVGFYGGES